MPINSSTAVEISYMKFLIDQEEKRQGVSENKLLMYNEDFRHIMLERIFERVSDKTKEKIATYVRPRLNPLKSIIDEISDIYVKPPIRTLEGKRADAINEIYNRVDIDSLMEIVNAYTNLLNDNLLYVVNRNGLLEIDILPPNAVTIITNSDDPIKMEKVYIKRKKDNGKESTPDNRYWVVWTKDEHYKIDGYGTITPIDGNDELVNPWGILPFVSLHRKRPVDSFWNTTDRNCLYEFCIQINIDDIMDRFTRFWNSFKTMAITGEKVEVGEGAILSPDHAVVAQGENINVSVLDFQVDFEMLNKDKGSNLEMISREYGVDAGSYGKSEDMSGRALLIKNDKLSRIRETQQKVYTTAEKELFDVINHIIGVMNGDKGGDESTTFEINFPQSKNIIEPKEELDIQEKEISMNITDIVDVFMKRNTGFTGTYEEAKKRLQEIHKSNNEFRQMQDAIIMQELNKEQV